MSQRQRQGSLSQDVAPGQRDVDTRHAELLVAADWLAEADTAGGRLRGQLAERVLPLRGLL